MKLLIIKLSSIGDLVHTIPAYKLLEEKLKDRNIEINWLVYENLAQTLYKPVGSDKLITLKDKRLTTLIQKATELKHQYDHVIDLQGLFKTALMSKIIAPKSNYGFKQPREAWASYFYKEGFCDYKSIESKKHVIDQNLELVTQFLQTILNIDINDHNSINFGLVPKASPSKDSRKKLCIIPATTWESKHWCLDNWASLINGLKENDYEFFMTGAPANINYLNSIQSKVSANFKIITNKKLGELYEFYSDMDLVIGVDTGPLHIASAALYDQRESKQVIGLYGPSSGSRSGPYGFQAISADEIFSLKASNKKTYLKDSNSINRIEPKLVLNEVNV